MSLYPEPTNIWESIEYSNLGTTIAESTWMFPTIETIHVTHPGKLLPDLHQRLLGHVSGELPVAQDPMRHRMEPIAQCHGQLAKGDSIALTRQLHEFSVHLSSPSCR